MVDGNSSDVERDAYYAILNVAKDASEEEIKKSYRQLAQICHPDKVTDPVAREGAAQNFTKIQEAYEVLSNEERRNIYDIYGRQGLESGLEVGEHLRGHDELKREFERFRADQAKQRQETSVAHRGMYIFKIDARDLMNPYDSEVDHWPELVSVATTNTVQIPLSERTAATIGCQVAAREVGVGSFLCGVKHIASEHDTVELHGALGLRKYAQLQVSRQLGKHTGASIAGSWHPQAGFGLVVTSSRHLGNATDADWTWQIGPSGTMGLGITRRGERYFLSCRFEAMSLGLVGKAIWKVNASVTLRASAKLSMMGWELELGGSQRVTEFSSAGYSVAAGSQGVVMKPRLSRGTHTFELPIILTQSAQDYRVLAVAYIVPPIVTFVVKYGIVKPLLKRSRVKKAVEKRMRHLEELNAALEEAAAARLLMQHVAERQLKKEVQSGGLVIVSAKYGHPAAIQEAERLETLRWQNGAHEVDQNAEEASTSEPSGSQARQGFIPASHLSDSENDDDESAAAGIAEAVKAALPKMPPAWLDVTVPARRMVSSSALHFHKGVSKSGLMGFCDVAPGEEKQLVIDYLWQGQIYRNVLADKEGSSLPVDSSPVEIESERAQHVSKIAQRQGLFAQRNDIS